MCSLASDGFRRVCWSFSLVEQLGQGVLGGIQLTKLYATSGMCSIKHIGSMRIADFTYFAVSVSRSMFAATAVPYLSSTSVRTFYVTGQRRSLRVANKHNIVPAVTVEDLSYLFSQFCSGGSSRPYATTYGHKLYSNDADVSIAVRIQLCFIEFDQKVHVSIHPYPNTMDEQNGSSAFRGMLAVPVADVSRCTSTPTEGLEARWKRCER